MVTTTRRIRILGIWVTVYRRRVPYTATPEARLMAWTAQALGQ